MLGALALLAGLLVIARRRRHAAMFTKSHITDDIVRQIEQSGYVEVDDEPLDIEQIQEEETRFWNEASWEETDEF